MTRPARFRRESFVAFRDAENFDHCERLFAPYRLESRRLHPICHQAGASLPYEFILLRHVLPNILPPVMVQATPAVAAAIIAEASLSFLGLGQQPPAPSWGSMLNSAQRFLTQAPRMAIYPGLAIFLTVLAFNLFGDGLRDALDPKK